METQEFQGLWELMHSGDCGHSRIPGILDTQEFQGLGAPKNCEDSGNLRIQGFWKPKNPGILET